MIITKFENGYEISLKLHNKQINIIIDFDYGITIPCTANLRENQVEVLLDGMVMANALKKKEIIFKNGKK